MLTSLKKDEVIEEKKELREHTHRWYHGSISIIIKVNFDQSNRKVRPCGFVAKGTR